MKKIIIVTILPLLLITGCGKKTDKVQSKKDMLNVIDNLDCSYAYYSEYNKETKTTNDSNYSCNLEGKYTVISEKVYELDDNKVRELTLQLNNHDLEFNVKASLECTEWESDFCQSTGYIITTDYIEKATKYFSKEFNKNNQSKVCNSEKIGDLDFCIIENKDDVSLTVNYINSYINYLNSLDIRFFNPSDYLDYLDIYFNDETKDGIYSIGFKPKLINGKYVLYDGDSEYGKEIKDLKEAITNYVVKNNIRLK